MTPEQGVFELLGTLAPVTALVGTRIRQLRLRQGDTLPAVRVQVISEPTEYHLRGGVGLYRSRVQVDAYAMEASGSDPYASATAVAEAIHGDDAGSGLSGWTGELGGSPPALKIHTIQRVDRAVEYDAEELRQVRCRQDYMVHWSRMR